MAVIDTSIAYVALPTIAVDLGITESLSVLVVAVYQLTLVMTILPLALVGDRIGHRRLYLIGQLLFLLASPIAALADNLWLLLAARAAQALGAAAGLAVCPALIRVIYPRRALGLGLGLNSTISASGFAVAPIMGGAILAVASWHWVFLSGVPFAVFALVLGRAALPAPRPHSSQLDLASTLLCAVSIGLVIGGLLLGVQSPWLVLAAALVAAGLAAGYVLVRRELESDHPVLPIDLLGQRRFALSAVSALLAFMGQTLLMIPLPFLLQHRFGYTPVETGFAMAPWAVVAMVLAPVAGALSDRVSSCKLGLVGLVIGAAGMISMTLLPPEPGYFAIGWRMVVTSIGFNLFYSPNTRMVIGAAPPHRTASAGSMLSTLRLGGHVLGATVTTILIARGTGNTSVPYLLAAAVALAAAFGSWSQRRPAQKAAGSIADATSE